MRNKNCYLRLLFLATTNFSFFFQQDLATLKFSDFPKTKKKIYYYIAKMEINVQ